MGVAAWSAPVPSGWTLARPRSGILSRMERQRRRQVDVSICAPRAVVNRARAGTPKSAGGDYTLVRRTRCGLSRWCAPAAPHPLLAARTPAPVPVLQLDCPSFPPTSQVNQRTLPCQARRHYENNLAATLCPLPVASLFCHFLHSLHFCRCTNTKPPSLSSYLSSTDSPVIRVSILRFTIRSTLPP